MSTSEWFLYLLECTDGSLYTGIAVDVQRRYALHAAGKGARYTRAHPPLRLLGFRACGDRASASSAEHAFKKLKPAQKRLEAGRWQPAVDADEPAQDRVQN